MGLHISPQSSSTAKSMHLFRGHLPCHLGNRGFTIVELVVSVSVISILLMIAVPAFSDWRNNAKLKSVTMEVVSSLQLAKIEASKRNDRVVVSFTSGAYNPAGQVGSYEVFVDRDQNFTRNGSDNVIAQHTMPPGISLYAADFSDSAGLGTPASASGFRTRGLPLSSADGAANAGVAVRNSKSKFYRVLLSPAGNIRLQTSDNGTNWR